MAPLLTACLRRSRCLIGLGIALLLSLLPLPAQSRRPARHPDLATAIKDSGLPLQELRAPLDEGMRLLAGDGKLSPVDLALCLVGTPPGFNPSRPHRVLVISATTDRGHNSNRELLLEFARPALASGWIVLAADPAVEVTPAQDRIGLRHALLLAALDGLRKQWPGMTRWPRAYAGFSGGAKIAGYLAAVSTDAGQPPCGVFLTGGNEDTLTRAKKALALPAKPFLDVPVFLSSGLDDRIATPVQQAQVKRSLLKAGFQRVELKSFVGGHEVYPEHITDALAWFAEIATLPASEPAGK